MAFIKTHRVRRNSNGDIVAGSAEIVESKYDTDVKSGHSTQIMREHLGKILALSDDGKSGVFETPGLGIRSYDATADQFAEVDRDDPRIATSPRIDHGPQHARFGDIYLLTKVMKEQGLLRILRDTFPDDEWYERALVHVLQVELSDTFPMTCDVFVEDSVLGNLFDSLDIKELRSDYDYFCLMGRDQTKCAFFKAVANWARTFDPDFGRACYIDASSLPSDSSNPYNALRCEEGKECHDEMRLALVIDSKSGLPVWYEVLPGDQMEVNTLQQIIRDVNLTLGIKVESMVVDSGYCSRDLIEKYMSVDPDCPVIVRMPRTKGYPYKALYHDYRNQYYIPKYCFARKGTIFFGRKQERELFGVKVFMYVYVDHRKAENGAFRWQTKDHDEMQKQKQSEQRWNAISSGFFVLISNQDCAPAEMLERYLGRTDIETVIKDAKSFEELMPLRKWNHRAVRGKILQDIFDTIIRTRLLKIMFEYLDQNKTKVKHNGMKSVGSLFQSAIPLASVLADDGVLWIDKPTKRCRESYRVFDVPVPPTVALESWREWLLSDSV